MLPEESSGLTTTAIRVVGLLDSDPGSCHPLGCFIMLIVRIACAQGVAATRPVLNHWPWVGPGPCSRCRCPRCRCCCDRSGSSRWSVALGYVRVAAFLLATAFVIVSPLAVAARSMPYPWLCVSCVRLVGQRRHLALREVGNENATTRVRRRTTPPYDKLDFESAPRAFVAG